MKSFVEYGESKALQVIAEGTSGRVREVLEGVANDVTVNEIFGWLSKWMGSRDDSHYIDPNKYKPQRSARIVKADTPEGQALQKQIVAGIDHAMDGMKKAGWTGKYYNVLQSIRDKHE